MTAAQVRSLAGLLLLVLLLSGASEWWREHQATALGRQLALASRPGDIQMLSSLSCVFCDRARRWMGVHQVPFTECFIERDADCARRYQALGARGTPTLLVRGQAQLGFSADHVLAGLRHRP